MVNSFMNTLEIRRNRTTWDSIGVGTSALCVVHCVLTPVALSFAPALSQFLPGDTQVHRILVVLVVSFGLLAFVPGYRKHRKAIVFLPMLAGVWSIGLGSFGGASLGPLAEKCLTILGSTLVITAHGLNRTFCKYCDLCNADEDNKECGGNR